MHQQAYDFVARHCADLIAPRVLEVGSCDVNGSVRPLFAGARAYHGIDVVEGPGVDEVADGAIWRSPGAFEVAVSTEVLEHAPRWAAMLFGMWEGLVPGGRLIVTCATDPRPPHSAVDGLAPRPGEHYANVEALELVAHLRALAPRAWRLEVHTDRGDLYLRADKAFQPVPT